jgi:hypothetical protein
MWMRIYQSEPILLLLAANTAILPSVFSLLSAFNHPLTDAQQHAIVGVAAAISALIARQSVVSPSTAGQQLASQQAAQKLGV